MPTVGQMILGVLGMWGILASILFLVVIITLIVLKIVNLPPLFRDKEEGMDEVDIENQKVRNKLPKL